VSRLEQQGATLLCNKALRVVVAVAALIVIALWTFISAHTTRFPWLRHNTSGGAAVTQGETRVSLAVRSGPLQGVTSTVVA
jgi:hypothetical protein